MDVNAIVQIIGSLGFPIAMCVYMMVNNNKTLKELSDTINHNSNVMERILDKIGLKDSDEK